MNSWRDTPLEKMENRGLSEQERASLEAQKQAINMKSKKKDAKVVKDASDMNLNE